MNIEVKGLNVACTVEGEGEAAVFLHGWGANRNLYDNIAAKVSEKYKVIAPDFPGFGGSDEPKEAWNVEAYADFVIELLQKLDVKKAVLIGHSFGGRVIFKLFEKESLPFEIDKVILIDSAGVKPKKTAKQKIKQRIYKMSKVVLMSAPVSKLFPNAMENFRRKNGSADYNAASPMMRQCLVLAVNEDLTHVFPRVYAPTLLIWGDEDDATPLSDAKLMEEQIPDSGLVVCEGAGHFSFLQQPAKCLRVICSFLNIE